MEKPQSRLAQTQKGGRDERVCLRDSREKEMSKDLKERSRLLARAIIRFDLPTEDDPYTDENELKETGRCLRRKAGRLRRIGNKLLDKAGALRELWRKL